MSTQDQAKDASAPKNDAVKTPAPASGKKDTKNEFQIKEIDRKADGDAADTETKSTDEDQKKLNGEAKVEGASPSTEIKSTLSDVEMKPIEEAKFESATTNGAAKPAQAKVNNGDAKAGEPLPMLRTTRLQDNLDRRVNNKFDPKSLGVTDDPNAIRRQVHYYFSNSNFPQDKHMWEQAGGTENKAIPLKKITSFKRMRRFEPYEAIITALKASDELIIDGEDGVETVCRREAYKLKDETEFLDSLWHRSVYVKGFGDEQPDTQFKVEKFFDQFGQVNSVQLRRTAVGFFKGSVWVEFATEDAAEAFVKLDPQPTWKGHKLMIMSKQAYCDLKADEVANSTSRHRNFPADCKKRPLRFFQGNVRDLKDDEEKGAYQKKQENREQRSHEKNHRGGWAVRGGRGRGGRGRGRGNHRGGDRDKKPRGDQDGRPPAIQATNEKGKVVVKNTVPNSETSATETATSEKAETSSNQKRAREDDGDDAPQMKKVDTKENAAAA